MLHATVAHRFTDGEIREVAFHAESLEGVLDGIKARLQEWNTAEDEATTIRIMTAQINGHA